MIKLYDDQNDGVYKLLLTNKKFQNKPIRVYFDKNQITYDLKIKLLILFDRKVRYKITGFRLVREGPPDDGVNDTISDNFFDDKYNEMKIYDFKKFIDDKSIYKNDEKLNMLNIYYRTVMLTINVKIIDSQNIQIFDCPLSLENKNVTKLIEFIQEQIQKQIDQPYYIFQDTKELEEIPKDADIKQYLNTGLIVFLFPIQAYFINKSNNNNNKITLESNKPLADYFKIIFESLSISKAPEFYSYHIQGKKENIDVNLPIIYYISKQKAGPITIEIREKPNKAFEISFFMNKIRYLESCLKKFQPVTPFMPEYNTENQHGLKNEDIFISSEEEAEKYKTVEQIRESETSVVFKIIEKGTLKPFCKKVLKGEKTSYRNVKNIFKEFDVLHSLNHPCICRAFKINTNEENETDNTTISIILEFIDFGLDQCLKSGMLSNTLKTRIVVEIAHALKYLHSRNHIYRDLNINSIMLNSVFQTKMIDFGLLKLNELLFGDETMSHDSLKKKIGSEVFMSPEMANDDDYDNKTDVYSFGAVVYTIFVGELPKQTISDKIKKKAIKLPKSSPSISPICINLMSKCLSINPDRRPTFNDILDYLRKNKFMLSSDVDPTIIAQRDYELEIAEFH